jgi:hypothetical protein
MDLNGAALNGGIVSAIFPYQSLFMSALVSAV